MNAASRQRGDESRRGERSSSRDAARAAPLTLWSTRGCPNGSSAGMSFGLM